MKQYAIIRRKRKRNPDGSEVWLVEVHPGDHNQNEARRALKSHRINRKSNEYDCVALTQVVQAFRLEPVTAPVVPSPGQPAVAEQPAIPPKPVKGAKPVKGDLIADRFA